MVDWDLLIKHLDQELTPEEQKIFDKWVLSDYQNQAYLDNILKIWQTPENAKPAANPELAWQRIAEKAGIDRVHAEKTNPSVFRNKIHLTIQSILESRILQAAAVLIFIILLGYYFLIHDAENNMVEIHVPYGEQKNIVLPDDTRLLLDSGSNLTYSSQLSTDRREVHLNGEGYFEVAADSDRPFIIHANQAIITVLGTSFNVRAWYDQQQVTVAVAQGKVALSTAQNNEPNARVVITQNQVSHITGIANPTKPEYTNLQSHLSWKKREMYFTGVPLQEVLDQLQRWYNLEFQLPEKQAAAQLVTVYIENKPVEEIINLIAVMNNYSYDIDGNKIIFFTREKVNI